VVRKNAVYSLGSLPLLRSRSQAQYHVDAADNQHPVLCFHFASCIRSQLSGGRIDLTRLQRAPKGSSQSASRCSNDVVERRCMGFDEFPRHFVVLSY
jgi:hypothetical protein